ncbi:MAG TPA: S8 family serine peptidase [Thermoanaerobaculia bacterium]|nr:S8 family serine peptidase [Thermoanaerobaculia bacterium]
MMSRSPSVTCRSALTLLVAAAIVLALPAIASAESYVLTAGKWGQNQNDAVSAAGGTVVWSHGKTGIAVVTSDDPGFAAAAQASGAFQTATQDFQVQWQPDITPQAITPGDEARYPLQWSLPAISADDAWAAGCTGDGARVAILDGGIYNIHPDIAPNLDAACSVSFVPGQPYNNDVGTFWHGTHVAGIVAAADNGFGTLGVAPEATLVGVKVLHNGSGSFGAVIGGILYASDPAAFGLGGCAQADIINMSLGAIFQKSAPGGGPLVAALAKAVNYAASKGVLVVSAAANNGLDLGQLFDVTVVPCESGSGACVSATGPLGWALGATDFSRPASYSNYGEGTITVSGPGGDFALPGSAVCTVAGVTFPCWVFDMVVSSCRGASAPPTFSVCWAAGTSMATPAVSGVAALIKGANPGISLGALKAKLQQTSDDLGKTGHDEFYGHGWVNAFRACTE